jgi:hypothetical protein
MTAPTRSGTFVRIRGDVAHDVRWYVDNQAIVLYIDSAGPIVRMLAGPGAQLQVFRLADDYLSGKQLGYSRPTELNAYASAAAYVKNVRTMSR